MKQLVVTGVTLEQLPEPPRRRKMRKPVVNPGGACIVCGRDVSLRSTYTQCLSCRQAARNMKGHLLAAVRSPKLGDLLEVSVGTIGADEAPAVLVLLQRMANRLRAEVRGAG